MAGLVPATHAVKHPQAMTAGHVLASERHEERSAAFVPDNDRQRCGAMCVAGTSPAMTKDILTAAPS